MTRRVPCCGPAESAAWITVDDTGARHKARQWLLHADRNEHFAWFGTTGSKSRLDFLDLLRAGHTDYVINAEALDYLRAQPVPVSVITRLAEHPDKQFPT